MKHFPPLDAILDHDIATRAGWSLVDLAAAVVDGGARFLQIRAKMLPAAAFLDAAAAIVARVAGSGAVVIVNDRADLAAMAHADGVHVGQDDLAPDLVRRILRPDAIVGLSTHTADQINRALAQPIDYLAIGPVFATTSKDTGYKPVGLAGVSDAAGRAGIVPVIAIGGITLDTAAEVIGAGATSVAVISDLLAGNDPAARVRAYVERLARSRPSHDV